jgi:pimeloyl-ACP methyl ester carboxylesterase
MFYDVEGSGPPVLLFHGGMGTADMFADLREALNRDWTTIGIEQQGHGHTADIDRPLRFAQMADDTAAAIRQLGLEKCHAFGYSGGGNVALGLAIRHSELVDRIAICGTNADNDGLDPKMLSHLVEGAKKPPEEVAASLPAMLREAYAAVAPEPGNWPLLVHRVFELAATFEGWDEAELGRISVPLLVMVGDRDVVTVEHATWLSRQCPAGQLCVLPRTDHLAPISHADWVGPILRGFLAADLQTPLPMAAAHES